MDYRVAALDAHRCTLRFGPCFGFFYSVLDGIEHCSSFILVHCFALFLFLFYVHVRVQLRDRLNLLVAVFPGGCSTSVDLYNDRLRFWRNWSRWVVSYRADKLGRVIKFEHTGFWRRGSWNVCHLLNFLFRLSSLNH